MFKKKKIKTGNRIKIKKGEKEYEGILIPKIDVGDDNSIVIKLDNGYNIGIRYEKGVKIEKMKGGKKIEFKESKIKVKKDPKKPTISILGSGGTIASRVDYKTGAVFPAFSPDDMLISFPELKNIANVKARKLFNIFSEDMTPEHWKIISKEVVKEIKSKSDGIVLMHGTDTMHYTAAALSFMVQNPSIPIVLVGSQRSSDRGSSDNSMNLICSSTIAAESEIAEVGICMHGTTSDNYCIFHQGTKVRKMHTSRRDTFRSINAEPFAKIQYENREIEYLRDDYNKRSKGKVKLDNKINPDVGIIYSHPGLKPKFVEKLSDFYDGIVIAATGLGHVPTNPKGSKLAKSILPSLKSLIDSGIPVVFAPQTIYGRLNMNVYETGRILDNIGIIGNGCDWTPETALVKLMWVLGHTKSMKKVEKMMLENISGEISERTKLEEL